jgi:hypothetical protein
MNFSACYKHLAPSGAKTSGYLGPLEFAGFSRQNQVCGSRLQAGHAVLLEQSGAFNSRGQRLHLDGRRLPLRLQQQRGRRRGSSGHSEFRRLKRKLSRSTRARLLCEAEDKETSRAHVATTSEKRLFCSCFRGHDERVPAGCEFNGRNRKESHSRAGAGACRSGCFAALRETDRRYGAGASCSASGQSWPDPPSLLCFPDLEICAQLATQAACWCVFRPTCDALIFRTGELQ